VDRRAADAEGRSGFGAIAPMRAEGLLDDFAVEPSKRELACRSRTLWEVEIAWPYRLALGHEHCTPQHLLQLANIPLPLVRHQFVESRAGELDGTHPRLLGDL
jgi:hypothetical protein